MILDHAQQGTPEWHQARCGVLTASLFSTAIDTLQSNRDGRKKGEASAASEALASTLAIERITGQPYRSMFDTAAMREGREQEGFAREWYENEKGVMVQESGIALTDDRRFGYSTDGFVCHTKGAIEVKTLVSPQRIGTFVTAPELIVADFIDQCDGGMWLCHLDWIDLIVWIPVFESTGRKANVIRIERNETRIERLVDRLVKFDRRVSEVEALFRNFSIDDIAKRCAANLIPQEPITTVDFRESSPPWDRPDLATPITKPINSAAKKTTPAANVAAVIDNPFNYVRT